MRDVHNGWNEEGYKKVYLRQMLGHCSGPLNEKHRPDEAGRAKLAGSSNL
jgi:hypothetical protein